MSNMDNLIFFSELHGPIFGQSDIRVIESSRVSVLVPSPSRPQAF